MYDRDTHVETSPLFVDGALHGFALQGRWPHDTAEWTQFLVHAVRTACIPGTLGTVSPVFRVVEDLPNPAPFDAVGIVLLEGSLIGDVAIGPGCFSSVPPALVVLHPPEDHARGDDATASGCLFLPGIPHLGLDHRAAWVQTDVDGTVTRLVSQADLDPMADVDTAALAALVAA